MNLNIDNAWSLIDCTPLIGSIQKMKRLLVLQDNIEEILGSLDSIQRAKAPPFLFGKILSNLRNPESAQRLFNPRSVFTVSILSIIILLDIIVFETKKNDTAEKIDGEAYGISRANDFEETIFYNIQDAEYLFIL